MRPLRNPLSISELLNCFSQGSDEAVQKQSPSLGETERDRDRDTDWERDKERQRQRETEGALRLPLWKLGLS